MTGTPTVSVIIPCYNGHEYLEQAIQSALTQTHLPLEVIVVDDGSDDPETIKFIDNLGPEIKVVRQENKGLPAARNTGFRVAEGEYVVPLDCDDWLEPEFVANALLLIINSNDVDFAFSWMALEAEANGVLKKHYNFFEQIFLNQLPYCILQPKKIWEELGGYDEGMRSGYEDWEWNIRLGKSGYMGGVVPAPLFHYRVQSTAMLASISRKKHVELWMFIRNKHADLYKSSSLLRLFQEWKLRKSTRPLWLYFGWNILYKILPLSCFRLLVSVLFNQAHSSNLRR